MQNGFSSDLNTSSTRQRRQSGPGTRRQAYRAAEMTHMIQSRCSIHSHSEFRTGSFSSHRSETSSSPNRNSYVRNRARSHFLQKSPFNQSFDASHASSFSPSPSLTSGYISNSSEPPVGTPQSFQAKVPPSTRSSVRHSSIAYSMEDLDDGFSDFGDFTSSDFDNTSLLSGLEQLKIASPKSYTSASDNCFVETDSADHFDPLYIDMRKIKPVVGSMEQVYKTKSKGMNTCNTKSSKRPLLIRHKSLDNWDETFSETDPFTSSEFDPLSLTSEDQTVNLESPISLCPSADPTLVTLDETDEPIYIEIDKVSPTKTKNIPKPVRLTTAATERYLQIYENIRNPVLETRKRKREQDDKDSGCCPVGDSSIKEQESSSYVKNFLSWMSSKAELGTSKIKEVLPTRSKEDFHLVMIGLDGAGKTTILYRMKIDQYLNTAPTIGFNCERVKGTIGRSAGLTFLVWDVGGQEKIRPLWRSYIRSTDGIIFVLDSSDYQVIKEARLELHRTLNYQDNINIPLLIFANKQDLSGALTEQDVVEVLGLRKLRSALWGVQLSCGVTGDGLDMGLEMMHMMIMKRKMRRKRSRNKTK